MTFRDGKGLGEGVLNESTGGKKVPCSTRICLENGAESKERSQWLVGYRTGDETRGGFGVEEEEGKICSYPSCSSKL